jgi:S-adenosylmethionine:tRNA ribosyltransferase-isomerase
MIAPAVPELRAACAPAEERGRSRSDVRLLWGSRSSGELRDLRFEHLPPLLRAGDVLVVNDSATIAAALPGRLGATRLWVHLSTPLRGGRWIVELRTSALGRWQGPPPLGRSIALPAGASLTLLWLVAGSARLAVAQLSAAAPLGDYLARHGKPIHYPGCATRWPIAAYQTIFARRPGSVEMPSAARPFDARALAALAARGVELATLTLHAGVSSLEEDELPHPERYATPAATAAAINDAHRRGARVIAVGTTVVRALETACSGHGAVRAGAGWTSEVITPERGVRCVDGLLTGWHEPRSSHLWMLEAIAGSALIERSYLHAAAAGYLGHEFGDMHLIMP